MEFGFDGTSGKIDSLNHQMQFILSRLDAMNVGADYGSTSSKRTVTDKGKGVAKSTSKESMKGIEEEGGIHTPGNKEIPLFDRRLQKLEVPIFKGEKDKNPNGWLHKVERYFVVNRLSEKDKLDVVVLCLEGEVLDWY